MTEYAARYDGYWRTPGRLVESKLNGLTARRILATCGHGRMLDVGCGAGHLTRELLQQGEDSYGMDVSHIAVSHAERLAPGRFIHGSVLSLPFPDESFDTLVSMHCLEHLATADVLQAFREMHRTTRRFLFIRVATGPDRDQRWHLTVQPRSWWENVAFKAGFRKHPGYYSINPYSSLDRDGYTITIPLEKIPEPIERIYPLEMLLQERGLHMDMSRETGPRSDAHMARYALAAEWIRPGDTVLDCACGLGYGSATLSAMSRGKRYLAMDIDENAVAYGRDNFAHAYGVEFLTGDAEDLHGLSDASVDTLVSFETLEHVLDYGRFVAAAHRVLKPDGRIIVGVPNLWVDESGQDPNPYHHHVFDYPILRAAIENAGFVMEVRYAQSAPGGFKLLDAPRMLERRPLEPRQDDADTEWWLVVASVAPEEHHTLPYAHPVYQGSDIPGVVDFERHYLDPWIYRPLVQVGERLAEPGKLRGLAETILHGAPHDTADFGAALTVRGYQVLADTEAQPEDVAIILALAGGYLNQSTDNPHVLRWQVSLAFLGAQLALKTGDRDEAKRLFGIAAEADFLAFSPLLATKTVSAWYRLGSLLLAEGDVASARHCLTAGIDAARSALHAPDREAIGNPAHPFLFGFHELAEIAETAGQCARALYHLDEFRRVPGKAWRLTEARPTSPESKNFEFGEAAGATSVPNLSFDDLRALNQESTPLARIINRLLAKFLGVKIVRVRTLQRILDKVTE